MSTWDAPRLSNKRDNNLPKKNCNTFLPFSNDKLLLFICIIQSLQSNPLGLGMLRLVKMSFYLSTGTNRTLLTDLALSSSSLSEKLNLLAVTSVPGVWLAKKIASQTRVVLVLQNIHQHYRSSNPSDITFWCYVHLQDNNKGIAWDVPIQYICYSFQKESCTDKNIRDLNPTLQLCQSLPSTQTKNYQC